MHFSVRKQMLHSTYTLLITSNAVHILPQSKTGHWRPQEFCWGGVQQILLRTEDRQKGDLGAVAP